MNIGLCLTYADVLAAAERIRGEIGVSGAARSHTLSEITGAEVWIKFENLQYTGSFKERGALNRLALLTPDERSRGVVAMSAGNHAQGLAHHATRLGIASTIVMPLGTPMVKVARTRDLGADVVLAGETLAEAHDHALSLVRDRGLVFVPPYDCPVVMAGQGTVALELLEQVPELEMIVVPVGGGGLIAGCLVAAHGARPDVEVVGVQVSSHAAFDAAMRHVERPIGGETIAEGIAVAHPSPRAVRVAEHFHTPIVVVDDEVVEEAVALYLEIEKVVAEGAGAASLAALLTEPERFRGKRVGLVLSGGNVDLRILASAMLRALARTGRLTTLSIALPDTPGSLHRLTGVLAAAGANIVELTHDRMRLAARLRQAVVEIELETVDRAHADTVVAALIDAGFQVERHS
ncbi:MAG: threonine ammonia-lyase [Ilumatobacteraceae bacterium]